MATTLLSLVNLAMTFIAMAIMEKAGRRALIMGSHALRLEPSRLATAGLACC